MISVFNPYIIAGSLALLIATATSSFIAGNRSCRRAVAAEAAAATIEVVKTRKSVDDAVNALDERELCRELGGADTCD